MVPVHQVSQEAIPKQGVRCVLPQVLVSPQNERKNKVLKCYLRFLSRKAKNIEENTTLLSTLTCFLCFFSDIEKNLFWMLRFLIKEEYLLRIQPLESNIIEIQIFVTIYHLLI